MVGHDPRSSATAPDAWNAALSGCERPSILQTHQWGELKGAFGWTARRCRSDGGLAQVLLRRTPVGRIAYVARGPALTAGGERAEAAQAVLAEVHRCCREAGAMALKLEPEWADGAEAEALLAGLGFRRSFQSVQPRSTVAIDIGGSEEAILARMKPKTRYNVRLAARKGVTVRLGGVDDLTAFARLLQCTGERDGFGVHPPAYYARAFELFAPAGMAALLLAEHEGEALAGLMAFAFAGAAYYLYGASSDRHRNLMPTYALQWEAIRWARSRGCVTYDLWGIPDEVGQQPQAYLDDDPPARQGLWGVWRFKRGFGGEVRRYTGAWDYVYRPVAYRLYRALYSLRRRYSAGE